MATLSVEQVRKLYGKRAKRYDLTANLYYIMGFREWAYRKKAVDALNLKPGVTVVEIGCGTGLNFPLVQKKIGNSGKIIGVDLTDAMLYQAKKRVEAHGWSNVELIHSDASTFKFPNKVDGIFSTFALTLSPKYDKVIKNGSESLTPGTRWVIVDFKMPSNSLAKLAPMFVALTRPFGVTMDLAERHPWESIEKYFPKNTFTELYGGMAYLSLGEK